ncbi:SRPBCC family protein [Dactylosporangium sp. CS-033363]|uniref:SRPBCC family protein n=1 Tax=Dactylosporangium sp. CS-033363 TaxID=3239935 RepID=UPI003D8E1B31
MHDFTYEMDLPMEPAAVAALFTSADGVSRWWGPTEGDGAAGGVLVTSFGPYGANAVRVLESGPHRVVWESIAPDGTTPTGHTAEWLGTHMQYDIQGTETGSRLHFRHAGLTPDLACWDACVAAWNQFMASIRTLAETGSGSPFRV